MQVVSQLTGLDPAVVHDFFFLWDYITMDFAQLLSWGNCQASDRLVMERKLGRFPNERDLSVDFTPGVGFYFRYDDLINHPGRGFDGVLPMKIKDEIDLNAWLYAMIIPTALKQDLESKIPDNLRSRVIYVENDCKDIWDWSEKVYRTIERR